jgi:hypothetical protein
MKVYISAASHYSYWVISELSFLDFWIGHIFRWLILSYIYVFHCNLSHIECGLFAR